MNEVNAEFRKQGVLVVGAGSGDSWRVDGIRYSRKLGFRVPVATDEFRDAMGVSAFPETLFIDRKGRVAEHLHGGANAAYFRTRVQYLLSEPLDDAVAEAAQVDQDAPDQDHSPFAHAVYKVLHIFE